MERLIRRKSDKKCPRCGHYMVHETLIYTRGNDTFEASWDICLECGFSPRLLWDL